jgi:hypothetical protein
MPVRRRRIIQIFGSIINSYMQNKMRYKNLIFGFLILGLITGCRTKIEVKVDWQPLLRDALNQAIIKQKLPEIDGLLNSDTIYVFPQKAFTSKGLVFDSVLVINMPNEIGKFKLKAIDANFINKESLKNNISFIMISASRIQDKCVVQFSKESRFPDQENYISIDKGKLKVIFIFNNGKWIMDKVENYYG